ncbi:MAG: calcium-binding EGF-like domain-containing protein [Bacteroidota bacterium]|nr:calcium-binding EGF-like domain-containing protein [Bacteroidota bacterium]
MKKFKNLVAVFALATGLMFATSCKDECKDVDCGANGTCVEGVCDCNDGYEGDNCEAAMNAKFVGTYNVTDPCTALGYSQTVTAGSTPTEITFSNLGNFGTPAVVKATVSGTSISATNYVDAAGRKFTVTGSYANNAITLTYTVTYTDNSNETCANVTMTK